MWVCLLASSLGVEGDGDPLECTLPSLILCLASNIIHIIFKMVLGLKKGLSYTKNIQAGYLPVL
jgi:hypothetical protein